MSQIVNESQGESSRPEAPKKREADIPAGNDDVPSNRYGANISLIRRRLLDEKKTADWLRRRKGK